MDYSEFQGKIAEIKKMGFVESHRTGDTGIGKTLEDLLGIMENNIAGPDFASYELKAGRKNSPSMLTLFTKAPSPANANMTLLENFGYTQRKSPTQPFLNYVNARYPQAKLLPLKTDQLTLSGVKVEGLHKTLEDKELHITIDSMRPNSIGLKLGINENKLVIENAKNVEAYWDNNTLRQAFEHKYHRLIYVLADHKKENNLEYFWFNEAFRLDGFGFEKFSELVKEGKLKVDIRIGHFPDGRLHDHGTGFRILPKFLPQCFKTVEKIL